MMGFRTLDPLRSVDDVFPGPTSSCLVLRVTQDVSEEIKSIYVWRMYLVLDYVFGCNKHYIRSAAISKSEAPLMASLKDLRQKIENLEREKAKLREEMELLKAEAEAKAAALEHEVNGLREEAESLKKMLEDFDD